MESFVETLTRSLREIAAAKATPERLFSAISVILIVVALLAFFRVLRKLAERVTARSGSPQVRYLVDKAIHYTGVVLAVLTVFNRLGISFSALLGAAGIAGIAIGFAAQTSVSNVISGLFVMTERAFKLGDVLKIDSITGVVESFDLLSVRLKTFDNQLVRIPNETVIKANLMNMTHYSVRRFSLTVGVAYGSDLERVREVLLGIAETCEFAVSDPAPVVIFDAFESSSIRVVFGVWGATEDFLSLKNAVMLAVSRRFAEEGIVIPFQQIDVRVQPS
jgi:small-conductance mechanosensitive channel